MFMHKILRVLLFTAHAEKHWKTLTKAGTNPSAPRGNFFKIENEEKIEWANSSIFQNAFRKKKKLYSFSIHTEQEKNNASHSKLILLEGDATRFEDFKSDLFSGIQKVLDFE